MHNDVHNSDSIKTSRADRRKGSEDSAYFGPERRTNEILDVEITQQKTENELAIELKNQIIALNADEAFQKINEIIDHDGSMDVVFDMKRVPFMDSAAIELLIRMQKRLEGEGRNFSLKNVVPHVKAFMSLLNLDDYFLIEEGAEKQ